MLKQKARYDNPVLPLLFSRNPTTTIMTPLPTLVGRAFDVMRACVEAGRNPAARELSFLPAKETPPPPQKSLICAANCPELKALAEDPELWKEDPPFSKKR